MRGKMSVIGDSGGVASLGARHRKINAKANGILQQGIAFDQIILLPEDSDVDKLIKIDVIAKSKDNLSLMEKVLCSDDMLLVSRALDKSKWLANDPRITPHYLHTNLFPHMSSKAISKLLLSIRKNIRDEKKADEYFSFFMSNNEVDKAMHWLPMCSAEVIDKAIADLSTTWNPSITNDIFKRVARKKPCILKNFADTFKSRNLESYLKSASFLLRTNTHEFLNALENQCYLKLKRKATRFVLKHYAERVMNNKHIYITKVHLPTLAKYMGKENILQFLVDLTNNENLGDWFNSTNLKPFISEMPQDVKELFLKRLLYEQNELFLESFFCEDDDCVELNTCSITEGIEKVVDFCQTHEDTTRYDWHGLAPFSMALTEGIERCKQNSASRLCILCNLTKFCNNDLKNICALLDYFIESHINEGYRLNFVEALILNTYTHNYDDVTWAKLDFIFHKLGVYSDESGEGYSINVAKAIVAYNIINRKSVLEVITKTYDLRYIGKLLANSEHFSGEQKQKLFSYFYNDACNDSKHEDEDERFIQIVKILNIWGKDLIDFPLILSEIRDRITRNDKTVGFIRHIYKSNKQWRRILFRESFFISAEQNVCLNILKHDPNLIINNAQMQIVSRTDCLYVDKFLQKIRIYFDDLMDFFLAVYENSLTICSKEHAGYKAVTRGFCILLNRDQFCTFLKTYIPTDSQINWQRADMSVKSIQKYVAGQMYIVRPTIDVAYVMKFTEGDFLQYAVPTLESLVNYMPKTAIKVFVMKCLEGKISIRKLGVRVATTKLDFDQVGEVLTEVWETNRSYSLRSVLFKIVFQFLESERKNDLQNTHSHFFHRGRGRGNRGRGRGNRGRGRGKRESATGRRPNIIRDNKKIDVLWQTLKKYINSLTYNEDKIIYNLLAAVNSIPEKIQPEFCKISYDFLKKMPKKLNCASLCNKVFFMIQYHIENIDTEWLEKVLQTYVKDVTSRNCDSRQVQVFEDVSVSYILCSQTEEIQIEKYNKFFKPYFDHLLDTLKEATGSNEYRFDLLLGYIVTKAYYNTEKINYVIPLKLLETIKAEIEQKYPIYETYAYVCYLELAIAYFGSWQSALGGLKNNTSDLPSLVKDEFIRRSLEIFHHDTSVYSPSLYKDFTHILYRLTMDVSIDDISSLTDVLIKYGNYESLELKMMDQNFFMIYWKTDSEDDNTWDRDRNRLHHEYFDDNDPVGLVPVKRRRRRRNCKRRRTYC